MSDTPEFPITGMKIKPDCGNMPQVFAYGAFLGLCHYLLTQPEALEQFRIDTGHDFNHLQGRSPLDKMIDQATGRDAELFAAWGDWVAVNAWGVEGQEELADD